MPAWQAGRLLSYCDGILHVLKLQIQLQLFKSCGPREYWKGQFIFAGFGKLGSNFLTTDSALWRSRAEKCFSQKTPGHLLL
jgi:hypothetical protein